MNEFDDKSINTNANPFRPSNIESNISPTIKMGAQGYSSDESDSIKFSV
jgi:hypothetical protein